MWTVVDRQVAILGVQGNVDCLLGQRNDIVDHQAEVLILQRQPSG